MCVVGALDPLVRERSDQARNDHAVPGEQRRFECEVKHSNFSNARQRRQRVCIRPIRSTSKVRNLSIQSNQQISRTNMNAQAKAANKDRTATIPNFNHSLLTWPS